MHAVRTSDSYISTVTAAIIQRGGRILIARRLTAAHGAGGWEFPGGKVEPGETCKACLAREIEEELGLSIKVGGLFAEVVHEYHNRTIRLVAYKAEIAGGKLVVSDHEEIAWVKPGELENYEFLPADVPIVKRLAAGW